MDGLKTNSLSRENPFGRQGRGPNASSFKELKKLRAGNFFGPHREEMAGRLLTVDQLITECSQMSHKGYECDFRSIGHAMKHRLTEKAPSQADAVQSPQPGNLHTSIPPSEHNPGDVKGHRQRAFLQ